MKNYNTIKQSSLMAIKNANIKTKFMQMKDQLVIGKGGAGAGNYEGYSDYDTWK